jgi:hypothetical protein
MPHPLANLTPEEVRERATRLVEPVVASLLRAMDQIRAARGG